MDANLVVKGLVSYTLISCGRETSYLLSYQSMLHDQRGNYHFIYQDEKFLRSKPFFCVDYNGYTEYTDELLLTNYGNVSKLYDSL